MSSHQAALHNALQATKGRTYWFNPGARKPKPQVEAPNLPRDETVRMARDAFNDHEYGAASELYEAAMVSTIKTAYLLHCIVSNLFLPFYYTEPGQCRSECSPRGECASLDRAGSDLDEAELVRRYAHQSPVAHDVRRLGV